MKRTYFTRMAIPIIGIAFGFFISCSTLSTQNRSQSENALSEQELKNELESVENQISKTPDNPAAYYRKGELLHRIAQRQNVPDNRTAFYRQMQNTLARASALHKTSKNAQEEEKVDELLQVSWSFEHNQGVEILQADSTLNNDHLNKAASHFNNAITIIPDSAVSYKMKARALYRNHRVENAIQTLEAARNRIGDLPSQYLEQLAFLYLENGENQKAVKLYEEAETFSDDNLNLLHGLANAYITANNHKKAIQLLGTLVDNKPDNVIYLESYGTELYRLGAQQFDSLNSLDTSDSLSRQKIKASADTLMNRAEEQFRKVINLNPESIDPKENLAHLYKNYAVKLTQIKSLFSSTNQKNIEEQLQENLSEAASLYEELVQQSPDQNEYWKHLYQVYSYLGMTEKAKEAKAKANI